MSMDLSPASREAMTLSAPLRLVAGSLVIALLLNLLPWGGWALRVHPDFLLIMLLYWVAHESRSIGQGWGFCLGLLMDVANSVLLGQHALIYVVAIFLVQLLRLRILQLTVFEQALHIGVVLLLAQAIGVLLNLSLGRDFPGWGLWLAPVIGMLLWPVVGWLARLPMFQRRLGQMRR